MMRMNQGHGRSVTACGDASTAVVVKAAREENKRNTVLELLQESPVLSTEIYRIYRLINFIKLGSCTLIAPLAESV